MSCKDCSQNSPTTYSRCNPPVSSDCVTYQGTAMECNVDSTFKICKGQIMSEIQEIFFGKICDLIGDTSVTEVVIPSCLQEAWANSDLTILNLFNFILTQECLQKEALATLSTSLDTLNPIVNVSLCCCSDTCDPQAELRLSDALQSIVTCLCAAKAEAANALTQAQIAQSQVATMQVQIQNLQNLTTSLQLANTNLQLSVNCIITRLDNYGIPNCP